MRKIYLLTPISAYRPLAARVATLLPLPGFVYSVSMSLLMLFRIGGSIIAFQFSVDSSPRSTRRSDASHGRRVFLLVSHTHPFRGNKSLEKMITVSATPLSSRPEEESLVSSDHDTFEESSWSQFRFSYFYE